MNTLKKLFAALGMVLAASSWATTSTFYNPYPEPQVNLLYNLLFCDDISLFSSQVKPKRDELWAPLLETQLDKAALRKIADEATNEGRVRALAYNRLRAAGANVPAKILLGVIVEVPLEQGLDVLAAFSDGGVRYLNQSGKPAVFEGKGHPAEVLAKELVSVSQSIVDSVGPRQEQRRPPPQAGNVRLTFLVSDGLYFGEGSFSDLQNNRISGPVLDKATQLLLRVVDLATNE